jgi:PKD repeat protein
MDQKSALYVSAANKSGIEEVRYAIMNEFSYSEATVYIRVIQEQVANRPPVVMLPLEVSVLEDSTFSFPIGKVVYDDITSVRDLDVELFTSTPDVIATYTPVNGMVWLQGSPDFWGVAKLRLRVTDEEGLSRADSMIVTVVPVNDQPFAEFTMSEPVENSAGVLVAFTDKSHDMADPEGAIVAWNWDFGDGTTSDEQHPEHVFTESGLYTIQLNVTDNAGATAEFLQEMTIIVTSAETDRVFTFALKSNYPNPFNPSTTFRFELATSAYTELIIYNALGQKVAVLVGKVLSAGEYTVPFNAAKLSSGLYLYELKSGKNSAMGRMSLIK